MKTGEQNRYHQKDCDWCNKPFEAAQYNALYCSPRCRVAAHRAKKHSEDVLSDGYRKIWGIVAQISPDAIASLRDLYDNGDKDALRASLRACKSLLIDLGHWDN